MRSAVSRSRRTNQVDSQVHAVAAVAVTMGTTAEMIGTIAWRTAIGLGRCVAKTAERAIVPRTSAINDGEAETRSKERRVPDDGVARATRYCGWNSCRTMATRFR